MRIKKRVQLVLFLIITLLSSSFAISQTEQESIDKGYACLEDYLGTDCAGTGNTLEASFNLLSSAYKSGYQDSCKSVLESNKKDDCWGETATSACDIKSTSLAILALKHIGNNVDDEIDWLLSKKKTDTGLIWYLEIDSNNRTDCNINGDVFSIEENKKLSGSDPSGLEKAYGNYWFKINDISKNYTVTCDKSFLTTLIYQKPLDDTYHVSSEKKTAAASDSITERVNSYCLTTSSSCDYEGSLWAALAMSKAGEDITSLIPYLVSMSSNSENKRFLPSAFMYILTNSDDLFSELTNLQKTGNYWDEGGKNRFYDTSLALLALQTDSSDHANRAKQYLLENQNDDGCWTSDTAFVLYSGWPKAPVSTGSTARTYCNDPEIGYYCVSEGECTFSNTIDSFECSGFGKVCCKIKPIDETCSEKGGADCDLTTNDCDGSVVPSFDSDSCCIGDCVEISKETDCEEQGFSCSDECNEDEEIKDYDCNLGYVCCGAKAQESGSSLIWIIILIILIILVIIGIVFRNRLRFWTSGFRSKGRQESPRAGSPPSGGFFQPIGPFARPPMRRVPVRGQIPQRRPSGKDREFEETMKKLREMSK